MSRKADVKRYVLSLRRAVGMIPGARRIKRRLVGPSGRWPMPIPAGQPSERGQPPKADFAELAADYRQRAAQRTDRFILYRIIGNDLPPRHVSGQSRSNLAFVLKHEPELPGCEKRFVVNRIADPAEEHAVLELLASAGAQYIHIPFNVEEYRSIPWDVDGVPVEYAPWTERFAQLGEDRQGHVLMRLYRYKNNYVMNNNGARNAALREGRSAAKWVLPWDGNCFLTTSAWNEIVTAVRAAPELPFFIVPMARVTENRRLLDADFRPAAAEEPQVIFRCDTTLEFDPDYCYGRRPKVELLWRLGVPGDWDFWPLEPWDLPCPGYAREAGAHRRAGWVARLSSGQSHLEQREDSDPESGLNAAFIDRGLARVQAIKSFVDRLDDQVQNSIGRDETCFIRSAPSVAAQPTPAIVKRLCGAANEALLRGPYSVVDKQSLPPSGNRHDYWHPAPYYWPHPLRLPGLPYVRRDGRRVPGTSLYEPLSEKYDRTRLQRLFDDTFVLTMAWHFHRDRRYAEHAAALVRTWFLVPETAMNPHLEYAQVRRGHNGNKGSNSGVIEMKDLYYFVDAVRVLQNGGWLSRPEQSSLEEWLGRYLNWLQTSPQGREERAQKGNHGTYYDLQVVAIARFLGETRLVRETLRDSRSRVLQQFDVTGAQFEELTRTNTAHYCCFNLQGWIHLALLAAACGENLWSFRGSDGRGIRRAMEWLLSHIGKAWPYRQVEAFDVDRFYPVYHAYLARYGQPPIIPPAEVPGVNDIKPLFFPHDGIMPFWQLSSVVRTGDGERARR